MPLAPMLFRDFGRVEAQLKTSIMIPAVWCPAKSQNSVLRIPSAPACRAAFLAQTMHQIKMTWPTIDVLICVAIC